MKKQILFVLLLLICDAASISAQNAFTVHETIDSPIFVYYNTDTAHSPLICSIYPNAFLKTLNESDYSRWVSCNHPIFGAPVSVCLERDNDFLLVSMGEFMDTISGYVKKGDVAISIALTQYFVLLYSIPSRKGKKTIVISDYTYARVIGIKNNWMYVSIQSKGDEIRGWIQPGGYGTTEPLFQNFCWLDYSWHN